MRFFSTALFLSFSLATGGVAAQDAAATDAPATDAPGEKVAEEGAEPIEGEEEKVNINMPGGRMGGDGFPLHIFIQASQSVGSGILAGFRKDPSSKNYDISNDVGDFQPLNASIATSLFLQPMANYKGFSLATSMWYTFEQTPTDNPSGRQVDFGDPYTSLSYIFRLADLNLMFRPTAGFTLPLSYRSRYLTRIGGAAGSSVNWFYGNFAIGGSAMLRYNHDFQLGSPADSAGKAYEDRRLGSLTPLVAALRTGQDASAMIGNTSGPSSSVGLNLSYSFLEKITVSASLLLTTSLVNPIAQDEFTDSQATAGWSLPMVVGRTSTWFNMQGTYQILDWLGLFASYSAQQSAFAFAGRGYEPLDYEEYRGGNTQQSNWVPGALLIDYLNFSQNTMSLSAGANIFF